MSRFFFLLRPGPSGPSVQKQEVVVVPPSNQSPVLDADVGSFPLLFLGSSMGRLKGGEVDCSRSLLFIAAAVLRSGYVPSPTPVVGGVASGGGWRAGLKFQPSQLVQGVPDQFSLTVGEGRGVMAGWCRGEGSSHPRSSWLQVTWPV